MTDGTTNYHVFITAHRLHVVVHHFVLAQHERMIRMFTAVQVDRRILHCVAQQTDWTLDVIHYGCLLCLSRRLPLFLLFELWSLNFNHFVPEHSKLFVLLRPLCLSLVDQQLQQSSVYCHTYLPEILESLSLLIRCILHHYGFFRVILAYYP